MSEDQINELQNIIGYHFKNPNLLKKALTHSSYANEIDPSLKNNERLEFLGDAVLELCISEELFNRYPNSREGGLTNVRSHLVNEQSLANLARELHLQDFIFLGKGEECQGGRDRNAILCDAFESIFGAIFLDGGYTQAKNLVNQMFAPLWPKKISQPVKKDFKSRLQEVSQSRFKERPCYNLQNSSGPEHAKTYTIELRLPNGKHFQAHASSVKKAEQLAAKEALESFKETVHSEDSC
ncbi:MAG TPA: ribonuclease III [Desulfohalobiaceae bacterium]|nr:ribonuclease III [Desulfohalobiaceae bacterium]